MWDAYMEDPSGDALPSDLKLSVYVGVGVFKECGVRDWLKSHVCGRSGGGNGGQADPHLNLRQPHPSYKLVLQSGGEPAFDQLMGHLATLEANAERKLIYNSLGAAGDVALKRRVLEWCYPDEKGGGNLKLQDFCEFMGGRCGEMARGRARRVVRVTRAE